jgi:hypothetical protein
MVSAVAPEKAPAGKITQIFKSESSVIIGANDVRVKIDKVAVTCKAAL